MERSARNLLKRVITFTLMLSFPVSAIAADSSAATFAAPLESYLAVEGSSDSSGGQSYRVDIDQALDSGNRLLLVATRSTVNTTTQKFFGTTLQMGFATDSSQRWSHRGTFEFSALGRNLDAQSLAYSLNWNTDQWGIKFTPELGRIGVFAGMPLTRVDIGRLGLGLDINYYTVGPWRFLLSAAANNYYGDASSFPKFVFIVRYTSAGLFITNFYKSRYGGEVGYNFERGSVAFGAEQVLVGTITSKSLYISAEGSLSDAFSLRSEFGQSYAGSAGWYGTIGITYAY